GVEDALHVLARTHAAPGLHLQAGAADDPAHELEQGVASGPSGVQVDQVQPTRPLLRIGLRQRERVVAIAGFLRVIALGEAHDPAVAHVDRGIQGEAAHAGSRLRKLCSSRAPATAERSGWNWAPMMLPRRTIAANGCPWWVLAMQSAPW